MFLRLAAAEVEAALGDSRAVVLMGARQVGKSTLMAACAGPDEGWSWVNLDDDVLREAAERDADGFLSDQGVPLAIDEVQRVPELMLAIKMRVDRDNRPGQFLLSGSANILTVPRIADSLTGRAEYIRLAPLTQVELLGRESEFLPSLLRGEISHLAGQQSGRRAYAAAIATGGFPAAVRWDRARLARFFDSYVDTVIDRDLRDLADIEDPEGMRRLLRAIAATSGGTLKFASLGNDLQMNDQTIRRYFRLLEMLFLVRRVPAWSSNLLTRLTKAPKAYVADTGLLLALIGGDEERVVRDLDLGGSLFETFAVMEILRLLEVLPHRPAPFHFRDRDGREVDLLLERRDGGIVGIEVKASGTVTAKDFRGLRYLRDKLGDRFVIGVILYAGQTTVPFGGGLWAVPISALWGGGAPYASREG
ncbi:MAG: ATP-binding protein [Patulibacter sp.]